MSSWWCLTRSSGVVAMVLAVASIVWGLLLSARDTGSRLRPAWWRDLHNWLGGLALAFTGLHMPAAFADSDSGLGLKQLLVPNAASDLKTAMTFGVLSFYPVVVVLFTSWPKLRFKRRVWRMIHLLSVPAAVLHTRADRVIV